MKICDKLFVSIITFMLLCSVQLLKKNKILIELFDKFNKKELYERIYQ